jgi:tetratricopeptide (TPR) repeat protein
MFLEDGFDIDSAHMTLDIGASYVEFAACDSPSCDEHFKNAINHFNTACEIFEREEVDEGLANAKAGIAAVYRNQNSLEEAANAYEEAFETFNDPIFIGRTKKNLAEVYLEMAETTGDKEQVKLAKKLEKEAEKLLSV